MHRMFLVGFVVDNMAVGQIFLLTLHFSSPNWHSTRGPTYLSSETSTLGPNRDHSSKRRGVTPIQ